MGIPFAIFTRLSQPGARQIVEIKDARLFFAADRSDVLSGHVPDFWDQLEGT